MFARLARGLARPLRASPFAPAPAGAAAALGPALAAPGRAGSRSGAGLANLQILRGFAAGIVLVHHAATYAQALRGAERPFATLDAMMGLWGVSVFFALSGFLMAGLVTRDRPLVFLAHRVVRIFPTYLAVVALFAALFAALGLSVGGLTPLALSLAPAGPRSYPLNVEWTLVFETSFYVVLFLIAVAGLARRLVPLALGWLAVLAATFLLLPAGARDATLPPLYLLPLTAACMPFVGGLLLPRLIATGHIRPATGLLALPLAAACLLLDTDMARWLGGIAAVLLVGAAAAGPQIRGRGWAARGALALGDGSYVLYLVHVPVLTLTAWACPAEWSGLAYGATGIAAALAVTALLGPLDLTLYRRLRRRIDTAPPPALRRGLSLYLVLFLACAAWGSTETARNDWQDVRARAALAQLPPDVFTTPSLARTAISGRGLALPPSVQSALEAIEPVSPTEAVVSAFAYDGQAPKRAMRLALFCGGQFVGLDRPRRMRKDLAARPGFEGSGKRRIGYRMRIPAEACSAERAAVAVAIDGDGLMAVLEPPPAL